MIEGAFTYPTERDDWVKTLLIGGVLTFLGVLLIPLFLVYGYFVRAVRDSIDGEAEPPAFGDWGAMLVEGLQAWIIGLVYLLVPLVVAAVTMGGAIAAMATGSRAGAGAGFVGFFGGLALTFVLALVFGYVAVVAVVNFAHEGRFGAGFDVGQLREVGLDPDYAVAWLVSVVGFVVAGVVAGIPIVGWILGPFAAFYATVVAARLLAGGYLDATEKADTSPSVEGGQPAA